METFNKWVKLGLKIPKRLGKNVKKTQGDFFDSHCKWSKNRYAILDISFSASSRLDSSMLASYGKIFFCGLDQLVISATIGLTLSYIWRFRHSDAIKAYDSSFRVRIRLFRE